VDYLSGTNVLLYIFAATTLLLAVVTQLAGSGKIRRNGFIGIRIPPTMASDAAWTAGHKAAVLPSWIGFALTVIAAGVAQFTPVGTVICYLFFALCLLASLVAAWRGANLAES
jgi:hypothetical protein